MDVANHKWPPGKRQEVLEGGSVNLEFTGMSVRRSKGDGGLYSCSIPSAPYTPPRALHPPGPCTLSTPLAPCSLTPLTPPPRP